MADLVWTEPALQDLDAIADYIAHDKPQAARKLVKHVFAAAENLRAFPDMGSCPSELRGMPYRQIVVRPCRVFYRHDKSIVYILHVLRGEQMLRRYILTERDIIE